MSFSFESALASGRTGPVALSQLSGPGVPVVGVSNGTSGQSVSGAFGGLLARGLNAIGPAGGLEGWRVCVSFNIRMIDC